MNSNYQENNYIKQKYSKYGSNIITTPNIKSTNNLFMGYVPKKSFIDQNQIKSINIDPNIVLKGTPFTSTPIVSSSTFQIANKGYVDDTINQKLTNININTNNTNNKITHIKNDYNYFINSSGIYIVEVDCYVFLPTNYSEDNLQVVIINKSSNFINISVTNNSLIFNNFYTNPSGSSSLILNPNSGGNFLFAKNSTTNNYSWHANIY
jgi:hypothetical protein